MHYISEGTILVFLLQVAILLGLARALGEVFRRFGQPSVTAEILVGVVLGPTVFGRLAPSLQSMLFPVDTVQRTMLETVAWLGILLFLLKSGLETNFATAWRQRRQGAMLSLCDLTIPMVIAFIPSVLLLRSYVQPGHSTAIFALFIAVIMTISALPVTARILQDLRVYRTDLGLLIMSALTINDVAGWVIFALILGLFTGEAVTLFGVLLIITGTLLYAALCLSVGPRIFDRAIGAMSRLSIPEPAGSLSLVCIVGLMGGAITTWIGIHALFGFFIIGIMAGESRMLSEHTRHIFSQMVNAILVPLFFASIGLKLDFIGRFDLPLVLFILVIGILGRYLGAYIGSRIIRHKPIFGKFIALAHIPGGEMQIVIGMIALEYGAIDETVYVAIVFGALITSMITGPLMHRTLLKLRQYDWLASLPLDHILLDIPAQSREQVIERICHEAASVENLSTERELTQAVISRELQMSTALDEGVAIPHARIPGLQAPLLLLGRTRQGVEWQARDGKPVRLIFLAITSEDDPNTQLQMLRGISNAVATPQIRQALLESTNPADIILAMRKYIGKNTG